MAKRISGKVVYETISGGFWGIVADNGKEYRPVEMPNQLKQKGARVSVVLKKVDEGMNIFMWGEPVEIISFTTTFI